MINIVGIEPSPWAIILGIVLGLFFYYLNKRNNNHLLLKE